MHRLLSLLLFALICATPGRAAERALLAPQDQRESLAATASAAGTLAQLRRAAEASGSVRVIVGLRVPFAAEGDLPADQQQLQRRDIAAAQVALRARFSAAVARNAGAVRSYAALPFIALDVTAAEVDRLAGDPDVISLTADHRMFPSLKQSTRLVRAPEAWAQGFSGRGQTVVIIDSGVDKTHPFLAGKVVAEACFSRLGYCPGRTHFTTVPGAGMPCDSEDCAHGTHVAGIAAGRGSSFSGVARDATIISLRVANDEPGWGLVLWYSDVLAALDYAYGLRGSFRIAAVNLSLGYGSYAPPCDAAERPTAAAIANLRSAGIATVAASGNMGIFDGDDSLANPACISTAVSVGAVSDSAWGEDEDGTMAAVDKVTAFSNTSPRLSLLAPGALITSSVPGGGYDSWEGTSMAAPHVTGAFAVLRERFPLASVDSLLARLQATGKPVSDYRSPAIVTPRIDVAAALLPARSTLTVAAVGSGSMRIATSKGITLCSARCTFAVEAGSAVTVMGVPARDSRFAGWAGPCGGAGVCRFTMAAPATLTARFEQLPVYTLRYLRTQGSGDVMFIPSGGQGNCGARCEQHYPAGTAVILAAAPAPGMIFAGWSGACRGVSVCSITMTGDKNVTAGFARR